jgi:hypothetical protein
MQTISEANPEMVVAHSAQVLEFMLKCHKFYDQKVALAASEFFSGLVSMDCGEQKDSLFEQTMPTLLPVILEGCKF